MDGNKNARIEKCKRCKFRITQHETHSGKHGYSRFCTAGDGQPIELHDGYMEGPDGNCPKGFWADLEPEGPVDPQEWKQWNQERNREVVRKKRKRGLKKALRQVGDSADIAADAETALAVLVAAGQVPGWLADEIANELGTTTT